MKLADYQIEAIANGFSWECACGELFREMVQAKNCRKCRKYLVEYNGRAAPTNLAPTAG
jgi:hypothetical protein